MEILDGTAPEDFLSSNSLLELADNLEIFLSFADEHDNHISFYETYYKQLLLLAPNKKPYQVLKNEEIIAPYLLTNWTLYHSGEGNRKCIVAIIEQIRRLFAPSTSPRINEENVHELMTLVDQKYSYCSKVLNDKHLNILIVGDAYVGGNSLFMAFDNAEFKTEGLKNKDTVILSRVREDVKPEYAFLHELGHILHLRLTQEYSEWMPPKSFDFIQQIMFKSLADKSKNAWVECFADCFAIAALRGTAYEGYDGYPNVSDFSRRLMERYIRVLMDTYEDNPLGRCSWDELVALGNLAE